MRITIDLHDSWTQSAAILAPILVALAALGKPRAAGDDGDDLAELLDGIDDPEPAPSPAKAPPAAPAAPARPPAAKPFDGIPTTGKSLYRWATTNKSLPRVNAIGKSFGYPRMVSDWSNDQAVAVYRILTEPSANGAH
jgi:hypothetical protein